MLGVERDAATRAPAERTRAARRAVPGRSAPAPCRVAPAPGAPSRRAPGGRRRRRAAGRRSAARSAASRKQRQRLLAAAVERPRRAGRAARCAAGRASRPAPGRRRAPAMSAARRQSCAAMAAWASATSRSSVDAAAPEPARAALSGEASWASICAHRSRQVSGRKRRACRRTCSARLAMRRRGRRRATPDRVHRAEQLQRAVLGALGRGDARHRAIAEQHGLGQAAAFEHVESVGQQRSRPRRASRSHSAAASSAASMQVNGAAPAEVALGARQRRPQQLFGQQHLAFPQVATGRR